MLKCHFTQERPAVLNNKASSRFLSRVLLKLVFNTWWLVPRGKVNFVSRESPYFPAKTKSRETVTLRGKQNSLFPKGPVEVICYIAKQNKANFENRAEIPATTSGHLRLHALITWNSGQQFAGNSELFPVWLIVFAIKAFWEWTVSLLDVMWPWTSQWLGALAG